MEKKYNTVWHISSPRMKLNILIHFRANSEIQPWSSFIIAISFFKMQVLMHFFDILIFANSWKFSKSVHFTCCNYRIYQLPQLPVCAKTSIINLATFNFFFNLSRSIRQHNKYKNHFSIYVYVSFKLTSRFERGSK